MAENGWAQRFDPVATVDFFLQDFLGLFVFVTDVNDAFAGARDQTRNDHALDNKVRDVLHDVSVFYRARLAFIGIADDVFRATRRVANDLPFGSRRKSSPAQSAQTAGLQCCDGSEEIFGFEQLANRAIIARSGVRIGGQDRTGVLAGHRR